MVAKVLKDAKSGAKLLILRFSLKRTDKLEGKRSDNFERYRMTTDLMVEVFVQTFTRF